MALVWRSQPKAGARRKLAAPCEYERTAPLPARRKPRHAKPAKRRGAGMGDMGSVGALVIGAARGAPPGYLYSQGMRGMGASAGDVGQALLNKVTGGAVTAVSGQLDRVSTALKISTAAAVISAVCSVLALRR